MEDLRLGKLKKFYKRNRRLPSYSEMLTLFDLSSKGAIHKLVHRWMQDGLLKKDGPHFAPTDRFFALPFSGVVKAGFPTGQENNVQDLLTLDTYLVDNPDRSFLLKVSGDSLIEIGILPDDLAVIEKRHDAQIDDIVLAMIDREWTLKILKNKNGKTYLASANSKYPPFYPQEDLQIFGVVRSIARKL